MDDAAGPMVRERHALMKHVRVEVGAVWPSDGANDAEAADSRSLSGGLKCQTGGMLRVDSIAEADSIASRFPEPR